MAHAATAIGIGISLKSETVDPIIKTGTDARKSSRARRRGKPNLSQKTVCVEGRDRRGRIL